MRILVGKTFGIGNAILAVPMVKALMSMGHRVDLLVGSGPDDYGSKEVFEGLRRHVNSYFHIWTDNVPLDVEPYDVAVMAIPFDGRWQNDVHFRAKEVLDGRKRPDNVERLGFDMWKKHEAEYQMENARALGFDGPTPDGMFLGRMRVPDQDLVYLGIGFKRDPGGFGLSKHFGNERYARLLNEIIRLRPGTRFVSTGTVRDTIEVGYRIVKVMFELGNDEAPRVYSSGFTGGSSLIQSFEVVSGCAAYLGNDTGMMHAAASFGLPTFGLFAYPDLLVKNPPLCARSRGLLFTQDGPAIEEIARAFVSFVWG